MEIPFITANFIENNTHFPSLVAELREAFLRNTITVPMRHHHDFPNPEAGADSTLLLMPAWDSENASGVKIVTVNPNNKQYGLPSIQGTYIYFNSLTGTLKALLEAKSLTAKRTAAASALASLFLSRENASSLLMIGTGALAANLIMAHASVRPITQVFVWGRNPNNAQKICTQLQEQPFEISAVSSIAEVIGTVDIVSCATLSETPLVFGEHLQAGQHVDLVGAYKKNMREADNTTLTRASIYVDILEAAPKETGDLVIPLQEGVIRFEDLKADLFELCSQKKTGRTSPNEITLFKSVGHALEDLAAANYYYNLFSNE